MSEAATPAPVRRRVALVTNIPAPYRVPVYALLADMPGVDLKVFFCSRREPDREWTLPPLQFAHEFLPSRTVAWRRRFIHLTPDMGRALAAFDPHVVVTTGFNPSHLSAWRFAIARRAGHVAMTDGTVDSEAKLTWLHRALRRMVYARTQAFVGASEGSFALYRSYGVGEAALFKSALCADNEAYAAASSGGALRPFDLVFSGRFAPGKRPSMAIDVAAGVATQLGRRSRLLMVGSGELDAEVRRAALEHADRVDCEFTGFVAQRDLPALYARARVLLFPTADDTWGVVANEACAAGLPVIVSPHAGVAGELVRDGENGRVVGLDTPAWVAALGPLLLDESTWRRMSSRSRELVRPYTYANAAAGLARAVGRAAVRGRARP